MTAQVIMIFFAMMNDLQCSAGQMIRVASGRLEECHARFHCVFSAPTIQLVIEPLVIEALVIEAGGNHLIR